MLNRLAKLIDVKSIVTLAFTVLVFILALKEIITAEQVMMSYTTIIAFYFGTQSQKKDEVNKNVTDTKEVIISESNHSE